MLAVWLYLSGLGRAALLELLPVFLLLDDGSPTHTRARKQGNSDPIFGSYDDHEHGGVLGGGKLRQLPPHIILGLCGCARGGSPDGRRWRAYSSRLDVWAAGNLANTALQRSNNKQTCRRLRPRQRRAARHPLESLDRALQEFDRARASKTVVTAARRAMMGGCIRPVAQGATVVGMRKRRG